MVAIDLTLLIIISLIVVVILVFAPESPAQEGRETVENFTAGIVRLEAPPSVSAVGSGNCDAAGTCRYQISLADLRVSLDRPGDAAVTLHFRDQDAVAAVTAMAEDNLLQLSQTFEGPYEELPPVLNASDRKGFDGLVYDDQRLIVGNFTIDFNIRPLLETDPLEELELIRERASIRLRCGSDRQDLNLDKGEFGDLSMCGGSIFLKMTEVDSGTRGRRYACANISTLGGPTSPVPASQRPGDSVTVRFWRFDETFRVECGIAGQPITQGQVFTRGQLIEALLTRSSCSQRTMGGFSFTIPVAAWQPGPNSLSEEGCSVSY